MKHRSNTRTLKFTLLAIVGLTIGQSSEGQSLSNTKTAEESQPAGPTAEQTRDYLINAITGYRALPLGSTNGFVPGMVYDRITIKNGFVELWIQLTGPPGNAVPYRSMHYSFNLDALSPKVETGTAYGQAGTLILKCTSGSCIKVNDTGSEFRLQLTFDSDTLESNAKAFGHIIKLSGGKEKLF